MGGLKDGLGLPPLLSSGLSEPGWDRIAAPLAPGNLHLTLFLVSYLVGLGEICARLARARRIRQGAFRKRVLVAFGGKCAFCTLGYRELLDAAHIIPDGELRGEPIVSNGMSLCRLRRWCS